MNKDGLWNLFWATGSPLVWLLLRQEWERVPPAQTAFSLSAGTNEQV